MAGAKNLDSSEHEESPFAEVDVTETEELGEHDQGELVDNFGACPKFGRFDEMAQEFFFLPVGLV